MAYNPYANAGRAMRPIVMPQVEGERTEPAKA